MSDKTRGRQRDQRDCRCARGRGATTDSRHGVCLCGHAKANNVRIGHIDRCRRHKRERRTANMSSSEPSWRAMMQHEAEPPGGQDCVAVHVLVAITHCVGWCNTRLYASLGSADQKDPQAESAPCRAWGVYMSLTLRLNTTSLGTHSSFGLIKYVQGTRIIL